MRLLRSLIVAGGLMVVAVPIGIAAVGTAATEPQSAAGLVAAPAERDVERNLDATGRIPGSILALGVALIGLIAVGRRGSP